jgi:hypothetical protein
MHRIVARPGRRQPILSGGPERVRRAPCPRFGDSDVALAARRVHRADPVLAAGPVAALVVWLLHASLDWDWEMPAVTLVAVVLAGMLVARADTA